MKSSTAKSAAETSEESYRLDEQIGYLLRLAMQRHTAIFQSEAPLELTPTQFAALIKLGELGQCSQNQLGRETAMDVATIKGVVDRLRKKGLVDFAADPNDKRRLNISIAEGQNELIPQLQTVGHDISRLTLSPLTPSEQKTFLRLLKKLG